MLKFHRNQRQNYHVLLDFFRNNPVTGDMTMTNFVHKGQKISYKSLRDMASKLEHHGIVIFDTKKIVYLGHKGFIKSKTKYQVNWEKWEQRTNEHFEPVFYGRGFSDTKRNKVS